METDQMRSRAIRRIRVRRGFHLHLAAYLAVNALLVAIWALGEQGPFWPAWSLGGWSIGLAWHARCAYGWRREISEDAIRREMSRISARRA